MILSAENWFLIVIAFVWIIGAIMQDLKRREVDNLWNFSLIGVALAYRLSVSAVSGNYWFFVNGILGFLIFIVLGNVFYYSRLFAGGDAKLLMALGPILPLSYDWFMNLRIFGSYIFLFLISGSVYVLIWALYLVTQNYTRFSKEFVKFWKGNLLMIYTSIVISIIWVVFVIALKEYYLIFMSLIILLFPLLFVFAKAVEESCMIKALSPSQITEGDWLYKDITVNGKKIKSSWDGLSKRELYMIQKNPNKKILIKQGIPFTPSFLFALILLLIVSYMTGLF